MAGEVRIIYSQDCRFNLPIARQWQYTFTLSDVAVLQLPWYHDHDLYPHQEKQLLLLSKSRDGAVSIGHLLSQMTASSRLVTVTIDLLRRALAAELVWQRDPLIVPSLHAFMLKWCQYDCQQHKCQCVLVTGKCQKRFRLMCLRINCYRCNRQLAIEWLVSGW